jgi:hypothetical protein
MKLESLFGLPAHPLVVHIAVVLLPIAAVGILAVAAVPEPDATTPPSFSPPAWPPPPPSASPKPAGRSSLRRRRRRLAALTSLFMWSTTMTLVAFVAVGVAKGIVVAQSWWRSGLETLTIGGTAAALAYAAGAALGGLA